MANEARKVLEGMSSKEFDRLVLHLGRYTLRETNRLQWRTGSAVDLPGGETVESIVYQAIEKVWAGERNWNPEQNPDFKKYLMDVIDSLVNHLFDSTDNKMFATEPVEGSDDRRVWDGASAKHERKHERSADWMARQSATPEDLMLEKEEAERRNQGIEVLLAESRGDEELTYVIQAMLDGYNKAGEIAKVTGIDIRDVYNVMKRLDRKVEAVRKQLQNA
ncbi:MAG: hypothetical protein M3362_01110 [Acidobacteriota bacterium]|nr:hypothetical protein [Acidobacteriota bacterium]